MKFPLKIFIYFAVAAVFCAEARGGDLNKTVTADLARELSGEVSFLADSTCFGREYGEGGVAGAAFYIYRQLEAAGYSVDFQTFSSGGRLGRNVVARTPGKYSRYIVIGAYYDGLGVIDGVRYPGADTNASGVSGMLALARHFAAAGFPGGGTGLIFVAFDGHGHDLAGSRHFALHCADKIAMMINLDTIGSDSEPVDRQRLAYMMALGGERYAEALEWANRTVGLHLSYDYYGNKGFTDLFYQRTGDQKWFLEKGIPCVMFTSGVTMNTNKPSDLPSTLDYVLMVKRLRVIAGWIQSLLG